MLFRNKYLIKISRLFGFNSSKPFNRLFLPRYFSSSNFFNVNREAISSLSRTSSNHESSFERSKYSFAKLTMALAVGLYMVIFNSKKHSLKAKEVSEEDLKQDQSKGLKPLELNEANALTHANLIKQSGRVLIESSYQMVHRSFGAMMDSIELYKMKLHELLDSFESLNANPHNSFLRDELLLQMVETKSQVEDLRIQLKDLNILLDYSLQTLESASMAAYVSGAELIGVTIHQVVESIKHELHKEEEMMKHLELALVTANAKHIEVTKNAPPKIVEDEESDSEADLSEEDS